MKSYTIPNPAAGGLRRVTLGNPAPVAGVTDRAHRYRAQAAIEQTERRCIYCGRKEAAGRPMMVDHIDGHEEHTNPENLAYACRPCNTKKGAHYARLGAGRRTRQYNPRRAAGGRGLRSVAQFIKAISTIKGETSQMDLFDAQEMLHNTPPNVRSQYAREANAIRWGRRESVPF
jgi:hypothetical protein